MLKKLKTHLETHFSFLEEKRLFLAVSGGLDSMVLLHLFQQLSYQISILHCNFNLRGSESDSETQFVLEYANQYEISCFITYFDTEIYAKTNKVSIQVAARDLRYQWFSQQLISNNYDYVVTAHHADDDVETFLINLSRGTGIDGLTGIPKTNKTILRPLLPFTRQEIEDYAVANSLVWKEDSSNASSKYLRNKIRHEIVPVLKELHPNFLKNFIKTQQFVSEAAQVAFTYSQELAKECITQEEDKHHFSIEAVLKLSNYQFHLYNWLQPYGFSAWKDISDLLLSQTGKKIYSHSHVLLKNRTHLILYPKPTSPKNESFFIKECQSFLKEPIKLSLSKEDNISNSTNNVIFVNADKIVFPLEVRKMQTGDFFYPLGMFGKKKVSKYFKDEKYSLLDKENQWLLVMNTEIVWIIGKRADSRFIANPADENIVKIEITK